MRNTEQRDTELALGAFGSISHSLPSAVGGEDICCLRRKGLGGWENIRVLASLLSTPILVQKAAATQPWLGVKAAHQRLRAHRGALRGE